MPSHHRFPPFRRHGALGLWLIALLIALLCPGAALAGCASAAATGDPHTPSDLAMRWDPKGDLSLAQVSAPEQAGQFQPVARRMDASYTRQILWLRACLPPAAATAAALPRWLRVGPSQLDLIELFLPQGDGYVAYRSGDRLPFSQRQWDYRLFAFAVPAGTDPDRPIYLRIATSSLMAPTLDLWSEAEFRRLTNLDYAFYGVYGGTMVLMFAFSLAFYIWVREKIYLVFAINILAGSCLHLLNAGFGGQFLYPDDTALNNWVIALALGPVKAIHVWFFTCIFAVRQNLPTIYRLAQLLMLIDVLEAPLALVMDWRDLGSMTRVLGTVVGICGIPLIAYLGWKDRERRAYALAFVPWVVALLALSLMRLGWIKSNLLIDYSQEIGAFIHLTILPIVIARRTWQADKAKERAQRQALDEAHRAERELEERVARRTDELAREIRIRNALQEQLQEALETERAALAVQRQFVTMLSHEFRTPLAIIDTTAQRLGSVLAIGQPELAPRTGKIRRAVARLLNLLENCLAEERLATSHLDLRREAVDLRDFLQQSYGDATLLASRRIRLELPAAPLWVQCDRHLFDVALSNLVDNALKYSPEERPITIRLEPACDTGHIAIRISDQGDGVPAGERERIFDKFYRCDGNPRISGAGLGLHLARELIHRHGGTLKLEPQQPGQGAAFTLKLPLAA